tara:strand:+ start:1798 stop:1971 length:174 start_codon:yes stop_codon:yes gene_type:complete
MNLNNINLTDNQIIQDFLTKFYDISCSVDASNYTIDEFYDDFPKEIHDFLGDLIKNE